jgi:hypothetical protein
MSTIGSRFRAMTASEDMTLGTSVCVCSPVGAGGGERERENCVITCCIKVQ